MRVVIGYHGHCFDGMASAAVLTRFLTERDPSVEVAYRGLDHQPGGSHVPEEVLTGDENAVVDFRFTTSPRLTWWFDHHPSGVVGDEEHAALRDDTSGKKFFDPSYGSCCKLVADVLRDRFAFESRDLDPLIAWAHTIDSASFPDAESATRLDEPALRLMTVVEAHGDDRFLAPRIRRLAAGTPIAEVADEHEVKKRLRPLVRAYRRNAEAIGQTAVLDRGVVTFDVAGTGRERYHKFVAYQLFPEARYCVAITGSAKRAKVSVGSNPWAPVPRSHDIAALCARHGGGGHAAVGAVTLPPGQLDRARAIAADIASALREPPPDGE